MWLQASLGFIVQEQKLPGPFPHVSGGFALMQPSWHKLLKVMPAGCCADCCSADCLS